MDVQMLRRLSCLHSVRRPHTTAISIQLFNVQSGMGHGKIVSLFAGTESVIEHAMLNYQILG